MFPHTGKGPLHDAARELGLDYVPSVLEVDRAVVTRVGQGLLTLERRMVGAIGTNRVQVVENRSFSRVYLLYGVGFRSRGTRFRVRRKTLWKQALALISGLDSTKVGDAEFDRRVWLTGIDEEAARALLDQDLRDLVLALTATIPDVRIEDGRIDGSERWSRFRLPTVEHIVSTVRLIVDVAERLGGS